MTRGAPGRPLRIGMTVTELMRRFPDDKAAEAWFEASRWPDGRFRPDCGSVNTVAIAGGKPMPYRCRDRRAHFPVRKGTSGMKLYRDFDAPDRMAFPARAIVGNRVRYAGLVG